MYVCNVRAHIVSCVEATVWEGNSLLQAQISTDKELRSRYRGRVLHKRKCLHDNSGHSLQKEETDGIEMTHALQRV